MVRNVDFDNINWSDLYGNLKKAQQRWGFVTKVLAKTGEMVRARVVMYKAVFQTVLIYGSDS